MEKQTLHLSDETIQKLAQAICDEMDKREAAKIAAKREEYEKLRERFRYPIPFPPC